MEQEQHILRASIGGQELHSTGDVVDPRLRLFGVWNELDSCFNRQQEEGGEKEQRRRRIKIESAGSDSDGLQIKAWMNFKVDQGGDVSAVQEEIEKLLGEEGKVEYLVRELESAEPGGL